jgi:RNA polymerase-associated protein CTR9
MAELPPRQFDIPLGDSETITLDLNELDPDPTDLLGALEEARCPVWVWTKLAGEYWRSGDLEVAERIGQTARECTYVLYYLVGRRDTE